MNYDIIRKAAAIAFKKDKGFYKATTEIGEYSIMDVCEDAHNHAFMLGVEWANEQPQWISVDDELPKENELVFFLCSSLLCVHGYWSGRGWFGFLVGGLRLLHGVTHWMPIPIPPKKGGDQ